MKRLLYILTTVILTGCGYNEFDPVGPGETDGPRATYTISDLRARYTGKPIHFDGNDVIIKGYITTSDKSNNFYRTFIVEDLTGAVEIRAGLYDLHNTYAIGQQVAILTDGLTMGMENGLLQIGRKSLQSQYQVEYIDHISLLKKSILRLDKSDILRPAKTSISELTDDMIGMLVTIDDLKLDCASDTTWALPSSLSPVSTPMSVNLKFKSSPDDSIYVFTSGYANFAGEKVPVEKINITGILLKNLVNGKQHYQLKLRDANDVSR